MNMFVRSHFDFTIHINCLYTIPSIVHVILQGQSFDKICLYLPKPVFSHVALSRVRTLVSLSVVSETNDIVVFTMKYMNK
jgi:hypothetical protein